MALLHSVAMMVEQMVKESGGSKLRSILSSAYVWTSSKVFLPSLSSGVKLDSQNEWFTAYMHFSSFGPYIRLFWLEIRTQRIKLRRLIRLKVENSKIRKNDPPGAHGPPGFGRGWPHNPPLGPMGPHGSFMVAPLFNDEAAKSRYGAQWVPQGSPKPPPYNWYL